MKIKSLYSLLIFFSFISCEKNKVEPPYEVKGVVTATIEDKSWKSDYKSSYIELGHYFNPKFYREAYNNRSAILSAFTVWSKDSEDIKLGFSGWGCPDTINNCRIFTIRGRLLYPQINGVVIAKNNTYAPVASSYILEIIDADEKSLTIEGRFSFDATSLGREVADTVRVRNGYFKLTFPDN